MCLNPIHNPGPDCQNLIRSKPICQSNLIADLWPEQVIIQNRTSNSKKNNSSGVSLDELDELFEAGRTDARYKKSPFGLS